MSKERCYRWELTIKLRRICPPSRDRHPKLFSRVSILLSLVGIALTLLSL